MEAKTNYKLVGFTVILLSLSLIAFSLWLSVGFNQKNYKTYAIHVKEAVYGLSEESPVKYNGVQVGVVTSIKLDKNNPQQVRLLVSIDSSTPITTSTFATLIAQGITGTTYIGLSATSSELASIKKEEDEEYPIIPSRPSLLNQLDHVLKEVAENISSAGMDFKRIFDKKNADYLHHTLANLDVITSIFAQHHTEIQQMIVNTNIFMKNFAESSAEFKQMTINLKAAGADISKAMNAGKVTLDAFAQQTVPPAITLIEHLTHVSMNLEQITNQMRVNPAILIRGTTPPPSGPGE